MENGGYRSFDIVVYNLILFYHGYIWESIEIRGNVSIHALEKNAIQQELFLHIAQFRMKAPDEIIDGQNVWSYSCPRRWRVQL